MAGTSYTRQSTITDGNLITASIFNNEYNQILSAFAYATSSTTGHQHDGSAGQGGNIAKIGDQDFKNKVVISAANNRIEFYSEVSNSPVEQVRIQDGLITPVTDSDVDLGTTSVRFKDAFVDSVTITNNIVVGGTVDGRDVATDGTKLDGIEASATADQTNAEIRTAVEAASDSNVFTDADHTKLNAIEASATADQTDAQIRAAVEAATDSNVFTDADHTKLNAIEASADVTDTANVTAAGALMDSEVTNLAQVKAFASSDYATAAQGTLAAAALPKSGGAMTGAITTNSTFDGVDIATRDGVLSSTTTTANAALPKAGGTMSGALTVGVNDTGYDVKFFGATAGKSLLWDESADSLIVTGDIKITQAAGGTFLKFDVDGTTDEATVGMDATDLIIDIDPTNARASSDFIIKNDGTETFRIAANGVATFAGEITANGGIALGDNDKATFGAGDDLAIYHDGSNSYIDEVGTGDLLIRGGADIKLQNSVGSRTYATFTNSGDAQIYHNNALKLATTATGIDVTGVITTDGITSSAPVTITLADNSTQLTLESTDADAGVGPRFDLHRNSASPAASDNLGQIRFLGDDSAGVATSYAFINSFISDPADGSESGEIVIETRVGGANRQRFTANATATIINEDGVDLDFRVESDGNANMLFVDGGNNKIGIGNAAPSTALDVTGVITTDGITSSAPMTITTDNNAAQITLISTDADASVGPLIDLTRDSASPAVDDTLGRIRFRGEDANGALTAYAQIQAHIKDVSAGAVDGALAFLTPTAGAMKNRLNLQADELVINESSEDYDFRVESDGNTHALFVEASSGNVGIGTSSPATALSVVGDITTTGGVYLGGTDAANKLDDYEEGSFTPVIADADSGGNVASGYGNQRGFYTKVGRLVTCVFDLTNIATVGMTGTNDIYIRDLPFTASAHSGAPQFTAPVIGGGTMTSALSLYAAIQDNFSSVRLINSNQTAVSAFLAVSNINSGATDLRFSITYFAA